MRRTALLAALLIGAVSATPPVPALPPQRPITIFCAAVVTKDFLTPPLAPIVYQARIRTAPDCPAGGAARVRKASTVNAFHRYWPVFPTVGAWTVWKGELRLEWVGVTYEVQYWDLPHRTWVPAPVHP